MVDWKRIKLTGMCSHCKTKNTWYVWEHELQTDTNFQCGNCRIGNMKIKNIEEVE